MQISKNQNSPLFSINNEDPRKSAEMIEREKPMAIQTGMYYPQQRAQVLNQVFRQYLDDMLVVGKSIPIEINHLGYAPNREQICTEIYEKFGIYVDPHGYLYTGWFGEKIADLFTAQLKKDGKTKPTSEEKKLALCKEKKRQGKYAAKLICWLEELKKSGRKLKFNNLAGGTDNAWISQQTGIPYAHLTKSVTVCFKLVKKARKEIGLENFLTVQEFVLKEHSYQKLLDYGTDCRKGEVIGNESAAAQVYNSRHALRKFIDIKGLSLDSKIGAEFGILFAENLQEVAAEITESNTKKKFLSEMRNWQRYYGGLLQTDSLPPDFPNALKFLIEASGRTYSEIHRLCCSVKTCNGKIIGTWVKGLKSPSFKSLPLIHKIEEYFGLLPNTLAARVSFDGKTGNSRALRKGDFPELARKQRALVSKYLPSNFPLLPTDEQKELVSTVCEAIIKNTDDYRLRHQRLSTEVYRLKSEKFPFELKSELNQFIDFKISPLPPAGYKRGKNARWKKPDPEKRGTICFFMMLIQSLFGVLTSPIDKGGAGAKIEQLTLTHLVLPSTWRIFLKFMEKRYGETPVSTLVRYLCMVYPLLHWETGWIFQSPWLANRFEPVTGLVTEEEVAHAKFDWKGFLQGIEPEMAEIYKTFKELAKESPRARDSHLPILPILESDNPFQFLRDALDQFQSNIPTQQSAPMDNATALRNIVFLRILVETGLRRSNMVNLTWNKCNTGQLRRGDDGCYQITIPHKEFKNSHSSFFGPPRGKYPYQVKLSNTLTPLLDEYLFRCRDYLMERWAKSKRGANRTADQGFLFISTPSGSNQRLNHEPATLIVRNFSKDYLVFNSLTKSGIEGVESFGPHAVRHIIATYVLKKTGSFADAAIAIQDSEITVKRHYARYLPADQDKRIRQLITSMVDGSAE